MKITLAFDVYGTLVDPNGMAAHLARDVGAKAADFKAVICKERQNELLRLYQDLPRFDDFTTALLSLATAFGMFAFSNGKRNEIGAVLSNANILNYFEGIVTADDVRSFRLDPAVYSYARRATGDWSSPFWLVSSYPWDIIGARSGGLSSVWVRRSEENL